MRTLTLLTGGRQGLGSALLEELLDRGQPVLMLSRERPKGHADWVQLDLSDYGETAHARVAAAIDAAIGKHAPQRLVLVGNASVIGPIGKSTMLAPVDLLATCRINYLSAASIAGLAVGKAQAGGLRAEILNITTGAALRPIPGWSAYCSTKAAIRAFLDVLALETGAQVHHIDPGIMDTPMQREIRAASPESFPEVDRFVAFAEEGKLVHPESVAKRIVEAPYGTGGYE
jgi:benzil reductase ((S)-benzoin forming)